MAFVIHNVSGILMDLIQIHQEQEKTVYEDILVCSFLNEENENRLNLQLLKNFQVEELSHILSPRPQRLLMDTYSSAGDALQKYQISLQLTDDTEHQMVAETSTTILNQLGDYENGVWYLKLWNTVLETSVNDDCGDTIWVYYQDLSEECKKSIRKQLADQMNYQAGFLITVAGNDKDHAWKEQLSNYAQRLGYQAVFYDYEDDRNLNNQEEFYVKISRAIIFLMYIFAAVNSIMISMLWLEYRKKELLIRRAYGYTGNQILGYVYKCYMKFAGIAIGIVGVFQAIVSVIQKSFDIWILARLLFLLIGMSVTISLFVLLQVSTMNKKYIMTGLQVYLK